ncbi:hypothetical protein LSUCC0031_11430 [Rhodobacterales bacterium LSUCC0031]|nr:hypothetical protein [Rhodobacterales bacterium LSUCC0031]
MNKLRTLLLSLAVLAMIATGVGASMARGAMAADGQLCAVTAPAPIVLAHDGLPLFDAAGAPVTLDWGVCLDCLSVATALLANATGPLRPMEVAPLDFLAGPALWSPMRAAPGGQARAPPLAG